MDSVLVVDDDPDTVELLAEALTARGFIALRAHDGAEAMNVLLHASQTPCALLLDLHMPGMGGWELLATIRSYSKLAKVPVVLLTAYDVPASARSSFNLILRKPVTTATILKAIDAVREVVPATH